jgi:hypothetical protein
MTGDRILWRAHSGGRQVDCVVISCCSGAELQLLQDERAILRELYPDKSSLYERARDLMMRYRDDGFSVLDFDAGVR